MNATEYREQYRLNTMNDLINYLCNGLDTNQTGLAGMMRCSAGTITKWCKGESFPKLNYIGELEVLATECKPYRKRPPIPGNIFSEIIETMGEEYRLSKNKALATMYESDLNSPHADEEQAENLGRWGSGYSETEELKAKYTPVYREKLSTFLFDDYECSSFCFYFLWLRDWWDVVWYMVLFECDVSAALEKAFPNLSALELAQEKERFQHVKSNLQKYGFYIDEIFKGRALYETPGDVPYTIFELGGKYLTERKAEVLWSIYRHRLLEKLGKYGEKIINVFMFQLQLIYKDHVGKYVIPKATLEDPYYWHPAPYQEEVDTLENKLKEIWSAIKEHWRDVFFENNTQKEPPLTYIDASDKKARIFNYILQEYFGFFDVSYDYMPYIIEEVVRISEEAQITKDEEEMVEITVELTDTGEKFAKHIFDNDNKEYRHLGYEAVWRVY